MRYLRKMRTTKPLFLTFMLALALILFQPLGPNAPAAGTSTFVICADDVVRTITLNADGQPINGKSECARSHDCCVSIGGALVITPISVARPDGYHQAEAPRSRDFSNIKLAFLSAKPRGPPLSEDWSRDAKEALS